MPECPVTALLGPTNTGKTTRAIDMALSYSSAVLGFPLRLLAREAYHILVKKKGVDNVALVTGEEKIGPADAAYFVSTAEAMPRHRIFDCLVVDEIQLAADPDRGHIFTDRLLYSRGRKRTIFLGSPSIALLLRRLVPKIEITYCQRLSPLSHRPGLRLSRLPRHSAVVTFSVAHCYALAAELRALYGGTSVVLGALSPRTRNAQVEMFKSGEVDYVVATDAIGLGLNLPINHVGFASRTKFDGYERRLLRPPEYGQIAGRAGRGLREGSFGVIHPLTDFTAKEANQIIDQDFNPLTRLYWRNPTLDFRSFAALISSLQRRPRENCLALPRKTDDTACLLALNQIDGSYSKLKDEDLEQIWEFCRIPNFLKLMLEHHAQSLDRLWKLFINNDRAIPASWLAKRIKSLSTPHPFIEGLLDGIARIRELNYLTQHSRWVLDPHWKEETRRLEEAWSDRLHRALSERFVDGTRGGVVPGRHKVAIQGLWITGEGVVTISESQRHRRALQTKVIAKAKAWLERLVRDDATLWNLRWPDCLAFENEAVAKFRPASHPLKPYLEWGPHHLPEREATELLPEMANQVLIGIAKRFAFPTQGDERIDRVDSTQDTQLERFRRILHFHLGLGVGVTDLRVIMKDNSYSHAFAPETFLSQIDHPESWQNVGGYLWNTDSLSMANYELRLVLLYTHYSSYRSTFTSFWERCTREGCPPFINPQEFTTSQPINAPHPLVLLGYTYSGLHLSEWAKLLTFLRFWSTLANRKKTKQKKGRKPAWAGRLQDRKQGAVLMPPLERWPVPMLKMTTQQRSLVVKEMSLRSGYKVLLSSQNAERKTKSHSTRTPRRGHRQHKRMLGVK